MAKQLNVSLGIQVDTSQAKAQIAELQRSLQAVSTLPGKSSSLFDDVQLKKASQAAMELEQHLNKAVNVNTGKLDLSRFSASLKASNRDLNSYCSALLNTGSTGRQAFLQLAQAIATADTPVARVNDKVKELGTSLANTARWQISSSILHGFMGAVQSAYGYAQDLNESLNEIRIVTGKSTDTMDEFAVRANRAARALSTTTTAYTDAALIFYQQGLNDDQVTERTNATIKMAQAAGESATEVSSYMTAIWNNFDDGSKSLEYYGDVMSHLGAKTAASSAEIAEGLEKFAAIGDTVGLSYEYAASAVATVVDKTRQSADTVGTAFKTIFARLQGLQLGETLEDGTDLNKYSKALMSVGINIKDTNGQLKDTDVILDELGKKWQTLEKDEKSALAQTVAGTRQYTQLISLMDNYSDFKDNVTSAKNSEGTLSVQADIYAQSWEAAQERVSAAAENIYDSLIDDDFFIGLLGGFEKVLESIGGMIDGLGGMKGVLTLVSSLFLTSFANKMPEALNNLKQNFMVFTGQATKEMARVQDQLGFNLEVAKSKAGGDKAYLAQLEGVEAVNSMKQKLVLATKSLTEQEQKEYEAKIQNVSAMYDEIAALEKKKKALEEEGKVSEKALLESGKKNTSKIFKDFTKANDAASRHQGAIDSLDKESASIKARAGEGGELTPDNSARLAQIEQERQAHVNALVEARAKADELDAEIDEIAASYGLTSDAVEQLTLDGTLSTEALNKMSEAAKKTVIEFSKAVAKRTELESMRTSINGQAKAWQDSAKAITEYINKDKTRNTKKAAKEIDSMKKSMTAYIKQIQSLAKEKGITLSTKSVNDLLKKVEQLDGTNLNSVTQAFSKFASTIDGKVDAAVGELDTQLDDMRDNMSTKMHFSDEAIAGMERTAGASAELNNQLKNTRENVKGFGDEAPESAFKASTAVTQFGSAVMSAQMLVNSWKSAIDVWSDSSATGFEKVGAILSVVTATMSTFNAIQQFSTTLSKSDAIAKTASALGAKILAAATKGAVASKTAETGAVWLNNEAWYASPVLWIAAIIIGVVAVIAVITAAIVKWTEVMTKGNKIETENCDILVENAKKTKELTDANKELATGMEDLIDKYQEMNAEGENTAEILAEIQSKMPELLKSYRELSKQAGLDLKDDIDELERLSNIAKFSGDYSAVEKKQQEVDDKVAIGASASAKSGAVAASTVLAAAMQEEQGKVSGKTYKLHVGGAEGGGVANDEKDAVNILEQEMGGYAKNKKKNGKGIDLELEDYSNPVQMVDYYEKMVAARDRMLKEMTSAQIAESDTFREINEMIQATADQYQEAKVQADAYLETVGDAMEAEMRNPENLNGLGIEGEIDTMDEYLAYKEKYLEIAEKEYGLSEEQAMAQLKQVEGLERMNNEYALASTMLTNFSGLTEKQIENLQKNDPEKMKEITNGIAKNLTNTFGEMSDEELEIAVAIAVDADSIEEFSQQMQQAMIETARAGYQQSAQLASNIMQESLESGSINMSALLADDNFEEYLIQAGMTAEQITAASYEEQYRIVSDFYSKCNTAAFDSYSAQQGLYYQQIADIQGELAAYHKAISEGSGEAISETQADYQELKDKLTATDDQTEIDKINKQMKEMEENFEKEYGFDIESNATELQNELEKLLQTIEDLQNQKIEMAMDWGDVDELESGFKKAAEFTQMIQKDTKKVGNSYQMTASQAREWLEFYPELGDIAEVTTDGLISMNAEEVDAFIAGKEQELDASVETKIEELKSQRAVLEADLQAKQAELTAAQALAEGKLELEGASAQYLTELRGNLTQYYMDLGLDEVAANAAALETMGMNEETYSQAVADACETQAENMGNASEDGANMQAASLTQLAQRWASFGSYLINNIGSILLEIGKAILDPTKSVRNVMKSAWNASAISVDSSGNHTYSSNSGNYTFNSGDATQRTAALKGVSAPQLDSVNSSIAELENAIGSIDGQIAYLEAMGKGGLDNLGNKDPDDQGGGDNGSDKKKEAKDLKEIAERYHEITREIEMQERKLDELSKKKDRAFGKDKLKIMKEEQAALQNLYNKQNDLFKLQTAFLASDLQSLKDNFSTNPILDEDGNISNYSAMVEEATKKLNDATTIYNNSKQEDGDKDALEKAQKQYDKQMELLAQYEETLDAWWDQKAELTDIANQILDAKLEELDYKVNLQIEFSDDELEHLEYLLGRIETKAFAAAEAIANIGLQTQSVMNKTDAYKEGVEGILGNHGLSKEDVDAWLKGDKAASDKVAGLNLTESEVEKLREYTAGLRANNEALIELRQSVHDKMLETFDEWNEKIDRNINKLDHLKNVTESYRNIVDLVGKNNFAGGAETIAKLNESAVHQAGNYAQANIANRDRIAAQLQTTRDAYAKQKDTISEEERKMWEDTIKEMEDQLDEAEEAAMSSIEAWMEAINQQFIDSVSATMDKFSSAVAGKFANLNELSEAFERQQTANDRYLESYEKIYEFSKLNRDIEKSIDNTSNIKAKKELANLQAEINELEESGAEVSEYQMENLRKRYELKLAELALEEAQNAKSEVRMTRDSEGNWGYVYTADETQVAEAEQSYEDKLYALQQQNGEYINQLQESIITMQQEMYDKMQEIANDESLSIEERQAKMAAVQQYYKEQMDYYCSELGLALNNNKTLYEDDWTEYSKATGYKMSSNDDYVDNFAETDLAILTGFTNMKSYQEAFNTASDTMLGENNEAFDKWQQTMEDGPLKSMGTSFETLSKDIDDHLGAIEKESNETTKQITEDTKTSVDDYNGVVDAVIAWENQYSKSVDAMITESDNLITKFNQVLALWAEVKTAADAEVPEPPSSGGGGDDSGGGNGSGNGNGGGGSGGGGKPSWDRVVAAYNKINGGKWGNGIQSRISKGKADGFTEDEVRAGQQLINYTYPPNLNGMGYSREKAKGLMGYDTGGYTGAWGDNSGRLALLHQKELVLNQEDTANMLSAIDMIRQISSMIDLNAMSSMKGLGGILSAGGVGGNPGAFEQHVEIHASFPDATDHSEIEEAFNNLLNSASQYANRKL